MRSPDAFAHVLLSPGQLGLGRAYVSGALEVDDLDSALEVMERWRPPELERREQVRLALAAARAFGVRRPPHVPKAELRLRGRRHTVERDARAVRHHYDVSNEFFALFLDESMTYSCAIFSRGAETLEEAQREKLELVCTKLDLQEGQRVLDIGCGWGSFAIHAAEHHGVSVVGITLSEPQAELARRRVAERGLSDRIEIRVQDYRAIDDGPFDAVGSIGMVEHVGSSQIDAYARQLVQLVRPGGRVLNHGIARLRMGDPEAGAFTQRYVFPDGAPLHLSRIQVALERAGLETHHVEDFRGDYAETLRHWARRLDEQPRRGHPPRRARARPCLAALHPRRAARLRDRLHVGLPGALLAAYRSAAVSSSDAPSIPPRFGWSGAAAFTGTAGSTQRMTGGWHASRPMLAVYQSTSSAPFAAAC